MEQIKKTSSEWLDEKDCKWVIVDPDGWDRKDLDYSFHKEMITREEFEHRLVRSTLAPKNEAWEKWEMTHGW